MRCCVVRLYCRHMGCRACISCSKHTNNHPSHALATVSSSSVVSFAQLSSPQECSKSMAAASDVELCMLVGEGNGEAA